MSNPRYPFSLSVVIPVYNDEEVLPELHRRLVPALSELAADWEIVFVDDGGRDGSLRVLSDAQKTDPHVHIVRLARNFGQANAVTAGLDHAQSEVVVIMDSDLQDQPEDIYRLLDAMVEKDVPVAIVRWISRQDSAFKLAVSRLFYVVTDRITSLKREPRLGGFRAMRRVVVDELRAIPERTADTISLMLWLGFEYVPVDLHRGPRYAGTSGYTLSKMLKLSFDPIFSFSLFLIRVASVLGALLSIAGVLLAGAVVFVEFIPSRTWLSLDASSGIFAARWMGLLLIARSISVLVEASVSGQPGAVGSAAILLAGTGPAMPFTALWGHLVEWLRRRFASSLAPLALHFGVLVSIVFAVLLWIRSGSVSETVALLMLAVLACWFAGVGERPLRVIVPLLASAFLLIVVFSLNGRVPSEKVYRFTSLFHQVITLDDVRVLPDEGERLAAMADVAAYARRATRKDALFLTPPVGSFFRLTALRSVLVDFKGMPDHSEGMIQWRRRLENCYGGTTKIGYDAVDEMDRCYHAMANERLAVIRSLYGPDYALLYADTPDVGLPVLYANSQYVLVDLKSLDGLAAPN